jgi:hypothetical protein
VWVCVQRLGGLKIHTGKVERFEVNVCARNCVNLWHS